MELWGFDNEGFNQTNSKGLLLIKTGKKAGGGGGAKTDEVVIPAHRDGFIPRKVADQNLTKERQFIVEFQGQKKQGNRLIPDPNQTWSYRGVFRSDKPGITSKEAAEQVQNFIEELPNYSDLIAKDPTPKVYTISKDINNDGVYDHRDVTSDDIVDLSAIRSRAKDDPSSGPETADGSGALFSPTEKEAKLTDIDNKRKKIDEFIEELLAMLLGGGSMESFIAILNMFAVKSRLGASKFAIVIADAMKKHGLADDKTQKKMIALIRGGKTDASTRAEAEKLRNALENNKAFRDSLQRSLNESVNQAVEAAENVNKFSAKLENLNRAGSRWG